MEGEESFYSIEWQLIYFWCCLSAFTGGFLKRTADLWKAAVHSLSLPRNKVMEAVLEQIGIISFSNLDMLVFPVQIPDWRKSSGGVINLQINYTYTYCKRNDYYNLTVHWTHIFSLKFQFTNLHNLLFPRVDFISGSLSLTPFIVAVIRYNFSSAHMNIHAKTVHVWRWYDGYIDLRVVECSRFLVWAWKVASVLPFKKIAGSPPWSIVVARIEFSIGILCSVASFDGCRLATIT